MRDVRGVAVMNEQKARKLRRIEMAHDRFTGVLLAVGMPEKTKRSIRRPRASVNTVNEDYDWYDNNYRERVRKFYVASFTSAPKPNEKTVKKFVRSYMRWLQHQRNQKLEKWNAPEI